MRKQFHLVKAGVAVTAMVIVIAVVGLAETPAKQMTVASAVAPIYPRMAVAANAGGTVVIEAQVNAAGEVVTTRAVNGHSLLRQAAENAARRWRFMPAAGSTSTHVVGLTFIFRIMPRGTTADELTPVFTLPYQAEVRHLPFEPVIDSDPPSYVRPTRLRKGRMRYPFTPTSASHFNQTGKTEQAASPSEETLIKHVRDFARDEGQIGKKAWRRLEAYPREELVSSLTNIRNTKPEDKTLHVDIAFVLCNLDYEYDPNRQFIVTVFKNTREHALGEERLLSRLIRRGDHELLPVLFSAAGRSDGALSEGIADTFAEQLRSDPGKFLFELKGEPFEVRRKVYSLLGENALSEDDVKRVGEFVLALPRSSALAPVAREMLASMPKPQE